MSRGHWFLWRRFLRHDPSEEAATAIDMFRSCLQSPNQSEADVRVASPSRKTTPRALGIRRFTRPSSATGINSRVNVEVLLALRPPSPEHAWVHHRGSISGGNTQDWLDFGDVGDTGENAGAEHTAPVPGSSRCTRRIDTRKP